MKEDCFGGQELSSFTFVERRNISQIFWREPFCRKFRNYNKYLGRVFKDTASSPDLQLYIINNQLFDWHFTEILNEHFRPYRKTVHSTLLEQIYRAIILSFPLGYWLRMGTTPRSRSLLRVRTQSRPFHPARP